MFDFKKKLLIVAVASTLTACGGDNSSTSTSTSTSTSSSGSASTSTISGTASKGIIISGLVEAYPVIDGQVGTTALVAQNAPVYTSAQGEYSLVLPSDYTGPVKIVISATDTTMMKCDFVDGCGGEAFGATVSLESGFLLSAFVAAVSEGEAVSMPVTPLTHMAAALAESNAGEVTADDIVNAQSQVAALLGMTSITDVEIIDITDSQAAANADSAALEASMLNAVLLDSFLSESGSTGLNDAMDSIVQAFDANDGQLAKRDDNAGDAILSIYDISLQKQALLQKVKDVAAAANVTIDVTELETEVDQEVAKVQAYAISDAELTSVKPSPNAAATDLKKVKALVSDLRNLAYNTGAVGSLSDNLNVGLSDFETELSTVSALLSADTEILNTALAELVDLVEYLDVHVFDGLTDGQEYEHEAGVVVTDRAGSSYYDITIDKTLSNGAVVNLSLAMRNDVQDSGVESAGDAKSVLTGTIESSSDLSSGLKLTFKEDSRLYYSHSEKTSQNTGDLLEPKVGAVYAFVKLEQKAAAGNTFEGMLGFGVSGFNEEENLGGEVVKTDFNKGQFSLSGGFSNVTDKKFSAAFSLRADASSIDNDSSFWWLTEHNADLLTQSHVELPLAYESASNFVEFGSSLSFGVSLPALSDNVDVALSAVRNAHNDAGLALSVAYDARNITFSYSLLNDDVLKVTNQDGVKMVLSESEVGQLSGSISLSGTQLATIKELDSGLIKVTYNNGDFETLQ